MFQIPRLVFTLENQPRSVRVIEELRRQAGSKMESQQDYRIFSSPAEVQTYLDGGISPRAAVVLFDGAGTRCFTHLTRSRASQERWFPAWSCGAQWGVVIHEAIAKRSYRAASCAHQLLSNFLRRFNEQLDRDAFPWGAPRKGESRPMSVALPAHADRILTLLNTTGPNLATAIAHTEYAAMLPDGSRISWLRVVPDAARCDVARLEAAVNAMKHFEEACASLLEHEPRIGTDILAGVDIGSDEGLAELYLHRRHRRFSVARPDLHVMANGLFASENDEMPGGFPELFHLDRVYRVNHERWKKALGYLFSDGPVLFLVSDDWSKPYIPEMQWLVETLQAEGYPALFLTTGQLEKLQIGPEGIFFQNQRIGTIWRQFPIFETRGPLIEVVRLAAQGIVRLVPEFSHFGNKAWFPLFRRHSNFFLDALGGETFRLLEELLPDSHLVRSANAFPCTVGGIRITSLEHLRQLPQEDCNRLVLKICGANARSARSYGVLMGHGLSKTRWQEWIDEVVKNNWPFLVQSRLKTAVLHIGVHHTSQRRPERFGCRVLLRPWTVDGQLISVAGCAVPSSTTRVHGRVDMAIFAVNLDG